MNDWYDPGVLASLLDGEPTYRVRQVRAWLARGVDDPAEMTDLPRALRERLAEAVPPPPRVLRTSVADGGLTHKVLLAMGSDEQAVESVLMLYPKTPHRSPRGRATVCISTQAGCAMGCPFCATGQIGFRRQLSTGEIVRQVTVMKRLLTRREIGVPGAPDHGAPDHGAPDHGAPDHGAPDHGAPDHGAPDHGAPDHGAPDHGAPDHGAPDHGAPDHGAPDHVTNVVFMGMGEPLANLDATISAVRWLHDRDGFGLSARAITVSTVGLVPGIRRLAELDLPITLAVSLHAPDDALRDDLVPVNRQHPLAELLGACRDWLAATGRRLTFEYVLIDGINAAPEQAEALARLVKSLHAHVNLIPMNPTPAVVWHAPPVAAQRAFAAVLERAGVPATIRHNRGTEIDAACGQLYANHALASGRTLPAAVGAAERVPREPR